MAQILIPAHEASQWQNLLAEPAKHWRVGYSARTLAHAWHAAQGFPAEVAQMLSTVTVLAGLEPLLILPEYKVKLPGRGAASQSDIFVLGKAQDRQLVSIMIEGKVSESFDDPIHKWKSEGSDFTENKEIRLAGLKQLIGLSDLPDSIYYQLVHRTAAVIAAQIYNAPYAVMLVHSFSQTYEHWDAFAAFVELYNHTPQKECITELTTVGETRLFIGWVRGDAHYLSA